jgi:heat shock protein HslJ
MRRARLVVIPLALLLLASCAEDDGPGGSGDGGGQLEEITWILDETSVAGFSTEAPDEARATVRFEDQKVGGTAFCNQYGGGYEAREDGSMSIELGGMTQMACDEPIGSMEGLFVEALGEVTGYAVDGDTLQLTRDGGDPLSFTAQQPLPLEGTAWRLDGITTGTDAVSSTLVGTEITATFAEDGTLSGSSGCNTYTTSYTVDRDALTIDGAIMSTAMACEQDVMDQEAAYLAALVESAGFEIQGTTLTLLDADGGFLLSFVGD